MNDFSLHAAVRCCADDRKALEQLCRYITRPALANERVQRNAAAQVVLKLKTPWHDGTTHQGTPPLEFMQRLAALVPRPRLHLIRCHGVLAPSSTTSAKMRAQAQVVPQEPVEPADAAQPGRVRGEVCTSQAGADELGAAAQTGLRDRPRTLPELRRRVEDHRCDPGGAGDRTHPHAPGSAGPRAAACASAWAGAASGLIETRPIPFEQPDAPGRGAGCVRDFLRRVNAA